MSANTNNHSASPAPQSAVSATTGTLVAPAPQSAALATTGTIVAPISPAVPVATALWPKVEGILEGEDDRLKGQEGNEMGVLQVELLLELLPLQYHKLYEDYLMLSNLKSIHDAADGKTIHRVKMFLANIFLVDDKLQRARQVVFHHSAQLLTSVDEDVVSLRQEREKILADWARADEQVVRSRRVDCTSSKVQQECPPAPTNYKYKLASIDLKLASLQQRKVGIVMTRDRADEVEIESAEAEMRILVEATKEELFETKIDDLFQVPDGDSSPFSSEM